MQKYFNNVQNTAGDAVPYAQVTVTLTATGAAATIYSDNGITTKTNPIVCDAKGYYEFFAADGQYTLTFTGSRLITSSVANVQLISTASVKDFGAVGDGTTNDTAAFLAAVASLGSKGGTIRYFDKHLIDTSFTLPANVTIKGPMSRVGSPGTNVSAPYGSMAALIINSAATITLMGGAGLDGVLAYRKGMTFPAADSSAFAGTAFTAGADDCFVVNSMALGFNKAYYSTGFQRAKLDSFNFDCNNGIEIINCADIAYVTECHGWPFATIAALGAASTLQRSGTAFKFQTVGDWNKVTSCFSYGYYRGFHIATCNSMTLLSCGADSTGSYAGQLGFVIDGGSEDNRLIGCQTAAQETGYYISTSANIQTRLIACDSWACSSRGVLIEGGDVSIKGGLHRNTASGITINSTTARVFADGIRFRTISGSPFTFAASNSTTWIGDNDYSGIAAGNAVVASPSNWPIQAIASADPLSLPVNGDIFSITGTTGFGTLQGGWRGRTVTLYFADALTVTSSTGSTTAMRLSGSVPYKTIANSTLTLRHNGVQWLEVGRALWDTPVLDSVFSISDDVDTTKLAKFQVSGITTGTTRTFTFPDANTTLVGTDATQALTNKTYSGTAATINSGGGTAAVSVTSSGASNGLHVIDTGANGANIRLDGDGATTPNKYLRAQGGVLQFLSSAYGLLLTLSDAGTSTAQGGVLSVSPTAGVGYSTGAGGTVAQATNKATGVTLNKVCGEITMDAANLAADTVVSFVLTNSAIAATDTLVLNHSSGGTLGAYGLNARCAAGSATIDVRNLTAGALAEAVVLRYTLFKGVTA